MNFGRALEELKQGGRVTRHRWKPLSGMNGNMWLKLDMGKKIDPAITILPHIMMKTWEDEIIPWNASHSDLLAEDWEIL